MSSRIPLLRSLAYSLVPSRTVLPPSRSPFPAPRRSHTLSALPFRVALRPSSRSPGRSSVLSRLALGVSPPPRSPVARISSLGSPPGGSLAALSRAPRLVVCPRTAWHMCHYSTMISQNAQEAFSIFFRRFQLAVLLIAPIIFYGFTFLVKYPTIRSQQQDT